MYIRFLWPCIVSKVWRERKPTRCNNQMFIINFCLNMFRVSLCPASGEQRPCVTAFGALRWFCWMWLVAVAGGPTTATNHIQQNQNNTPNAVTQGLCSSEDGHNDARNMLRQKLIINIWLLHLVGMEIIFFWNVIDSWWLLGGTYCLFLDGRNVNQNEKLDTNGREGENNTDFWTIWFRGLVVWEH